jgi:hypothetical protein
MINIDTSYLKKIKGLTLEQLVFLNLVVDKSTNNQKDTSVISLIADKEIQDLIDRKLVSCAKNDTTSVYEVTQEFKDLIGNIDDPFEQFYNLFPAIVQRPDGTRGYLRTNVNRCRILYRQTIGKSVAMHNHIMECLQHEIDNKMMTNKLGYMKTMYKWLTSHEWETSEQQMKEDIIQPIKKADYGTELI